MTPSIAGVAIMARHELADAVRSRRALVLLTLYLVGSVAATAIFATLLKHIEVEVSAAVGLESARQVGTVSSTLWKSKPFREMVIHLTGDRALGETLLQVPPVGLFYGWLSLTFAPLLVLMTAAGRMAEDIGDGSARFILFRSSRLDWCLGTFLGQAGQLLLALLLSALGAWVTGWWRLAGAFDAVATMQAMLWLAFKAWFYALAALGLALGVSQFFSSPHLATVVGFIVLVGLSVLAGLARHFSGDGLRRLWDLALLLTPGGHRLGVWHNDAAHLLPTMAYLVALAFVYLFAGYAYLARRDL